MRDGVQIAADVWLPQDYQARQRLPALLRTTRYGRDGQFGWAYRLAVAFKQTDPHDEQTDYLNERHFVVIVADARGSGASGGHRETEFSREEISDLGELVNWAANQPWSNGRIGAFGGSYEGATAELTAVTNPPALKAVAPFSSQFDVGMLAFPGGIYDQAVRPRPVRKRIMQNGQKDAPRIEVIRAKILATHSPPSNVTRRRIRSAIKPCTAAPIKNPMSPLETSSPAWPRLQTPWLHYIVE
jgi:putative CocE/NonD family hydrolase